MTHKRNWKEKVINSRMVGNSEAIQNGGSWKLMAAGLFGRLSLLRDRQTPRAVCGCRFFVGKTWERSRNRKTRTKLHRINGPLDLVRSHNPKVVSSNLTPATNLGFAGRAQAPGLFAFGGQVKRGRGSRFCEFAYLESFRKRAMPSESLRMFLPLSKATRSPTIFRKS